MATRVFISYRRDDSAAFAGRVHDRLRSEFGREALFMDVDTVRLGVDFVEVISGQVAECDVLLAVIGSNWLNARDEEGNRRLDDPNDFPRIEIAAALVRHIPVIPILVDGTKIPRADQLPKDIKALAHRNALDVRNASFHSDIDRLIRELKRSSEQAGDRTRTIEERTEEPRAVRQAAETQVSATKATDDAVPKPSASRSRLVSVFIVGVFVVLVVAPLIAATFMFGVLNTTPRSSVPDINAASADHAGFKIYPGQEALVDSPDSFLVERTSGSIGDCQTRCEESKECRVFAFSKAENMCYLYTHAKLQLNPNYDTGLRQ
jgi:hypothetical protein